MKPLSFYLKIIDDLKAGKLPSEIADDLKVKRQALTPYIKELKKAHVVEKIGYGVWEINQEQLKKFAQKFSDKVMAEQQRHNEKDYAPNTVRGHGWQFTLKLPRRIEMHNRRKCLEANGIEWKPTGTPTWQGESFMLNDWKVWFTPSSIVCWYPKEKSIYSDDAYETFLEAVYRWKQEVILKLERLFNTSFKKDKGYDFETSAEHYALIKNAHAELLRHKKEKLYVYDEDGKLWLICDFSHQLDEKEAVLPGRGTDDITKVRAWENGVRKTGITPEFILQGFSQLQQGQADILKNQAALQETTMALQQDRMAMRSDLATMGKDMAYYAENLKSHVAAIQTMDASMRVMSKSVGALTRAVNRIQKEKQLKRRDKRQQGLKDFMR